MKAKTILFDMDGVLVECYAAFARIAGKKFPEEMVPGTYNLQQALGMSAETLREKSAEEGLEFWTELPFTPFGARLRDYMWTLCHNGHTVGICSDASWTPHAPQGKHIWLNAHGFKDLGPRVLTREKFLLARPNTVLVDDSEGQVNAFREHGGLSILVPRLWNCGGEQSAEVTFQLIANEIQKTLSGHRLNPLAAA
jgi:hypothetical protein